MGVINNLIKIEELFHKYATDKMKYESIYMGSGTITADPDDGDYGEITIETNKDLSAYKKIMVCMALKIGDSWAGSSNFRDVNFNIGAYSGDCDVYIEPALGDYVYVSAICDCKNTIKTPVVKGVTHHIFNNLFMSNSNKADYDSLASNVASGSLEGILIYNANYHGVNYKSTQHQVSDYHQVVTYFQDPDTKNNIYIYVEQPTDYVLAVIGIK